MPIEAWFMDADIVSDQREPHRCEPNRPVSRVELDKLGVVSWEGLDADKFVLLVFAALAAVLALLARSTSWFTL